MKFQLAPIPLLFGLLLFLTHPPILQAGEMIYDFNDANGVVDTNTIGSGITAGNVNLSSAGGTAFQNNRAELAVRVPNPTVTFFITIPAGTTADFTTLSFDYGFNETSHTNPLTPAWTLAISTGLGTPNANALPTIIGTGHFSQHESISLSGLTGLTNTTLTFTLTFSSSEGRNNSLARAHTIDNLTLTGSASSTPVPVIQSFTADDTIVAPGQSVILAWEVTGADSLSIDSGVGSVTPITTGNTSVTVNTATTYTLTATNTYGSRMATVTVNMNPTGPNILLVLVDDMGTEDTSVDFNYDSAGNPVDRVDPVSLGFPAFSQDNRHFITPNMDTLAANGMKFSRAYACQVCSPTRVTLMTGQNSSRHGTFQYIGGSGSLFNIKAPPNGELKRGHRTLAEVFRDAGYRTIMAGKGHMGDEFTLNAGNYKTPAADPYNDYYGFQINVSASTKGRQGSCYANASPAFGLYTTGSSGSFVSEYQGMTYNQLDSVTYRCR